MNANRDSFEICLSPAVHVVIVHGGLGRREGREAQEGGVEFTDSERQDRD